MKTLLAVLFILVGPLASAETPIPNDIFVVEADFKVTFYSNEFPQVIPHPGIGDMPPPVRVVYSVEATVEFCRGVSASDFDLVVTNVVKGYVLQLTAPVGMIDCAGSTQIQTVTYPMPREINVNLPFFSTSDVEVVDLGTVY